MTEQEIFVLAEEAIQKVVNQIKDEQWGMIMPAEFSRVLKREVTLHEIINYQAYDDAWVPDMLAGKTMDEVGKEAFKGDLLGEDPKASFMKYSNEAISAVKDFTDLERTVHLSYGDYPAKEYFWHINYFRGLRAYDLAKAIGVDTTLPADLVQGLWDEISPNAEVWRKIGVLAPEVVVPADADAQTKLLGLLGRA
jgi:uncharacterized protein (TIGR03086 family)